MARKQTRRSISISGVLHEQLETAAHLRDQSIASLIEGFCWAALGGKENRGHKQATDRTPLDSPTAFRKNPARRQIGIGPGAGAQGDGRPTKVAIPEETKAARESVKGGMF